jgi:two-component sensor histidine kinase
MSRTTDFGSYVKSLCVNLAEIQAGSNGGVTLTCNSVPLVLDLDIVTALGIIVTELVTNSYDHAFPDGKGETFVSVQRDEDVACMATMIISDSGQGFSAKAENKRHGLGLVHRLVEQVRGTATVESGHGTVWTIRFPAASAEPEARILEDKIESSDAA